jgi:nucleotide-binding universal stress UspA family protein
MKIMLAVDGSKYSEWAADLLLKLPLTEMPQISVLHVVHQRKHISPIVDSIINKQYKDKMQEKLEKDLMEAEQLTARIVDKLKVRWKDIKTIIEKGHVSERIIEKAHEEKADLIILGSRGANSIRAFLLGGVSQKVLTYSKCSVLVVKCKIHNFKRVLVAVDGSNYSDIALSFLKSHFVPEGVSSIILNVCDYPFIPPNLPVKTLEKEYCNAMFQAAFKAQVLCVTGDPAKMITYMSHRKKVDLVIVGSKGLSGIKLFFLGSVARKVVTYGDRSTLVVKK